MATLVVNPLSLDFGDVTQAGTAALDIIIQNLDDTDPIEVSLIDSSNGAFVPSIVSWTLTPKEIKHFTVTFTAGAPGAFTGTLTITSDAINNPYSLAMTATSVAAGTVAYSLNPSSLQFPDTKVGADSAIVTFVITNTGSVNIDITNVVIDAPFAAASPTPSYPQNGVTPGSHVDFGVKFSPVAEGYVFDTTAIHITSTAPSSPDTYGLAGIGVLILPVYVLTEFIWSAIAGLMGAVATALKFDPANWNCEALARVSRWHDFGKPGLEKTYYQMFLLYEDRGEALVSIGAAIHGFSKTHTNIPLGDNGSDDVLLATAGDAQDIQVYSNTGAIKTTITRGGGAGQVSILEFIHVYTFDDARVGSAVAPVTITPVFSLENNRITIAGLSTGPEVRQFDPNDLGHFGCEAPTTIRRDYSFGQPGFEDSLMRLQLAYEDKGEAQLVVTAYNRHGQASTQTLVIGTPAADNAIKNAIFDLDIEDEVLSLLFTRYPGLGPISITMLNWRYVQRGEVKKNA